MQALLSSNKQDNIYMAGGGLRCGVFCCSIQYAYHKNKTKNARQLGSVSQKNMEISGNTPFNTQAK
jgi:hypothetical protein